ncbi:MULTISPECIES: DUF1294 domain-containing protein [unclassified Nocardioides]|uniref:DUF1294 domain-containing protein n=1 Tax=unclassified Nocardioides TaxID=2615069 RepID=UPI001171D135|nr:MULTISPECIES: DUF1294 domain-containing protein [unclassified Nocardioides]TQK69226.1 uncharacterized membrane protein YsdA (DUF1294 family) [Nocardioides sp. SLBN-35]WGY01471.1 DUF1294 domain-containing protein [Nocardioides sp. QY071]
MVIERADVLLTLAATYGVLSLVALVLYRADKRAAQDGEWRTRESTLHLVALLGGWPGALAGRRLFRHKTRKQPFVTVLWLTVVTNVAGAATLLLAAPVDLGALVG